MNAIVSTPQSEGGAVREEFRAYLNEKLQLQNIDEDKRGPLVNTLVKMFEAGELGQTNDSPEGEALRERLTSARTKAREILSDKLPEFDKIKDWLGDVTIFPAHLEEVRRMKPALEAASGAIKNQLYDLTEEAFFAAADNHLPAIQPLILALGIPSEEGAEALVFFDDLVAIALSSLIEEGKLTQAHEVSKLVNQCRSAGYKGKSYSGALETIDFYPNLIQAGYRQCLRNGDVMSALSYREAAKKGNIDLSQVEAETETSIDLEALDRGELVFPGSS